MRAILAALLLLSLAPLSPVRAATAATPVATAAAPVNLVGEAEVKQVIGDFLLHKGSALDAQLSIKRIGYSGDLKLPAGRVSYEVVAPERWEGYGSASVALIVRVDDQVKKNLNVPVEVEALAEMVVATRTLERGEVLRPSDLALARRDLSRVQGRFVKDIDQAVGLRVKSALRANSPVRGYYLERVPLILSGQIVTIVVENEAVKITASGRAKGAGALGDLITVQNLSSQKDVAGRVVDSGTVRVDF